MNSLGRRLQLGLALSLVLLMAALGLVGHHALRALTEGFVASRLEHDAESLLAALAFEPQKTRFRWRRINQIYNQPMSGHYYVIHIKGSETLLSRSLWDQALDAPELALGETVRLYRDGPAGQKLLLWIKGYRKQGYDITVAVAEDLSASQSARERFMRNAVLLGLVGLALLLLLQGLVVKRSFRRLDRVRQDIRHLEQGRMGKLSEDVPSEILPLVQEFNHLLQLLAQRLDRSRNSLGNLAHALKGPLNLLMQYFDRAEAGGAGLPRSQAVLQVNRIRQLMERELKRARLAGGGLSAQRFDPKLEMSGLVDVLQHVYGERQLRIDCDVKEGIISFGDREDLLELLGNLLDNACKWATSRVSCVIHGDAAIEVLIDDDGEGLPDEEIARLAQRGVRLDETVEGHGLGLAICKDIVKLYGGDIQFRRSQMLGGLQVRIVLPDGEHVRD